MIAESGLRKSGCSTEVLVPVAHGGWWAGATGHLEFPKGNSQGIWHGWKGKDGQMEATLLHFHGYARTEEGYLTGTELWWVRTSGPEVKIDWGRHVESNPLAIDGHRPQPWCKEPL